MGSLFDKNPELKKIFDKGLEVRKQVMGEEYVIRALNNTTDFNRELQEMVTIFAWGLVWTRDEVIPRKIRSLINIGILAALNRSNELKLHVKGAIRNGCTEDEIKEVLIQVGAYCGLPAAMEAFRIAQEAIDELKKEEKK
ncbi:gamma carboxymuconolactone decarboxylase [Sulfolobus sp. A20]|uniref:carboxymuconolactone decarboxylase family protein n=1 Tax=Saccharolobus sp. A20 TaxID=1891280 RepID=UPI000845F10E|nr:carboxymuconolactone decarboxylase family protein [Sulfolobus sp. A20]TRM76943.1 gamma carboxymuconolactone decarboxylase [Sulfolobus sp. E5]TRM77430.1 gamma carboxymuconolactone decarboxylase [Sulfolobus sp. A20-N-F8]TRM78666.1 gamma carboxymuconolactone decarboxylase [Sulfolobus sp. B5]TRM82442.1 gamma carboxymuconolactone decarboxylase [Sulfolobus sp. D5]TRM84081.1 gamma carboxymuconolactone decarboxylase [Sulfolobus sp. A20-N-F6]TRM87996.1 gamma carboxymuconolactone decarboxylase [Sulf